MKRGKSVDLDDLLRSKEDSFTGTFGKDEFDEFKDRMTESFYADSDEAIQAGITKLRSEPITGSSAPRRMRWRV